MYLKSITLKGFKSFPDRTRLEFGPGVSVVVGPNGSGKSNITDAVLWALGEQSPVAVRGQSMQDVIFAGAPGRQASQGAEVELVLDDSDGLLGLGTTEVSILRRLDRSGEGEYRLSGARCRLIDVIEVLSDTGLGKEMHSVISQGRVEAIVTSKPRDRRMLIEEAAGLGKHRKRRRRAQLKLARTQENLDRALDVEREARSRLRPLKRQAEAAELHARLERQTLEVRWELGRAELRGHLAELAEAQSQAAAARDQRETVEGKLEATVGRRQQAEEALARRSSQREELSRRSFTAQAAQERIAYRAEHVHSVAASIEARTGQHRDREAQLRHQGTDDPGDETATAQIAGLEARLAELERDRLAELDQQLAGLREELEAARRLTAECTARATEAGQRREAAEQKLEAASAELRQAEQRAQASRLRAAEIGGELAAVNQFLRAGAGRPGGAPVLADQLEVDPGCELAVAAALDGRLRAAVVADRGSAGQLLDAAGSEGGRALIADPAQSRPAPEGGAPTAGARRLIDHLKGPDTAVGLARALLADVWLVESLDDLPSQFGGVAVTPSGRVLSGVTGEMRQAPAVGEERILAERNRREQLISDTEAAAQAEAEARRERDRLVVVQTELEAERERRIAQARTASRERDEATEEQRRIERAIQRRSQTPDEGPAEALRRQLAAELERAQAELEASRRERVRRQAQIEQLQAAVARDQALLPALRALAKTLETVAQAVAQRRAGFEAELAADRQAGEHVAAELRACAQEEASLQAELHRCNERLTEREVALQRARDRAQDSQKELAQVASRLELEATPAEAELDPEHREALAGRLERLTRRREQLGPVNPLAQQEYAEAVEHVEELERQRTDLETALRELAQLIADTDRQIRELFEQTFTAAAANFERVCSQLFPGGRGRLRLVAEREGPARVLGAQATGPESEEPEAEGVDEAPEGEEEPLGVEIEVNPAGKDMRRLSLMSGGEKAMTALAFLFSVFLASPCPFYILDEVEAALDDLNIDRFLGLLRAYSKQAQFIVVTHQRRTMEAADFLYGVSMGGDGISKVISRRLPQDEPVEEAEAA
jgi:chromosome segregation protein